MKDGSVERHKEIVYCTYDFSAVMRGANDRIVINFFMKILLLAGICVYATENFIRFHTVIGFVFRNIKTYTNASSKSKRGKRKKKNKIKCFLFN